MSLLSAAMEPCIMLDKVTADDGRGGWTSTWKDGAGFSAAIVLDDSIQAQQAMSAGVYGVYTVTTRRNVNLQYHDVFRRTSDKKIFRVVTDGDDKKTPNSAGLDMRQVRAQEWNLTGSLVEDNG